MPTINVSPDYFDHPKTRRLVALLGKHAESLPIRLWVYCAKYHPKDGRLKGYSAPEIESAIGWHSEEYPAGYAVECLLKVGFLESDKESDKESIQESLCHDWLEYQGHIIKYHERAKAMNEARWTKTSSKVSVTDSATVSAKKSKTESLCSSVLSSTNNNTSTGKPSSPSALNLDPEITGQTVWAAWVDANRAAKRADPTPLGPQTKAAKTLATVFGELAPIKVIFAKYLADKDPFIAKAGHPLAMLPARVDVYRNAGVVQHGSNRGHSNAGYQAPADDKAAFRAVYQQKLEESRRRNKALEQSVPDDAIPALPQRPGGEGEDLCDDDDSGTVPY